MEITDAENLSATELRLGLPGTSSSDDDNSNHRSKKPSSSPSSPAVAGAKRALDDTRSEAASGTGCTGTAAGDDRQDTATPLAKAQVVGWPPVRAYRKNTTIQSAAAAAAKKHHQAEQHQKQPQSARGAAGGGGLYVKVSMDGAPYLRKVDLRMYKEYRELRDALDALFFAAAANKPAFEADHQQQYAVAYEDKDGDLMLVGDVPWDMFVSSCKKLRIMRGSEAR